MLTVGLLSAGVAGAVMQNGGADAKGDPTTLSARLEALSCPKGTMQMGGTATYDPGRTIEGTATPVEAVEVFLSASYPKAPRALVTPLRIGPDTAVFTLGNLASVSVVRYLDNEVTGLERRASWVVSDWTICQVIAAQWVA